MAGTRFRVTLLLLVIALRGIADDGRGELRWMSVELTDGSRVFGKPAIDALACSTSFADMNIPLHLLESIEILDDRERAQVGFANENRLTVALDLAAVELSTLFGDVDVPFRHVAAIDIRRSELALPDLLVHYSFDANDGSEIRDVSGNGMDTKCYGATWCELDEQRGACSFDGAGDYVELPPGLPERGPVSVAFWFTIDPTGFPATLFGSAGEDEHGRRQGLEVVWDEQSETVRFTGHHGGRHEHATASLPRETVLGGAWHHLVAAYNNNTLTLYLDGQSTANGQSGVGNVPVRGRKGTPSLGKRAASGEETWYLKGMIDEFVAVGRALEAREANRLYRLQKPRYHPAEQNGGAEKEVPE